MTNYADASPTLPIDVRYNDGTEETIGPFEPDGGHMVESLIIAGGHDGYCDVAIKYDQDGVAKVIVSLNGNTLLDWEYPKPEHKHRMGMKINGLSKCYDCDYEEYDSQWGAGLFSDWPRGHHKPYGS